MTRTDRRSGPKLAALYLSVLVLAAAMSGGFSHGLLSDQETLSATLSVAGNAGGNAGNAPAGPGAGNAGNAPAGPGAGNAPVGNAPGGPGGVPLVAQGSSPDPAAARVIDAPAIRRRATDGERRPSDRSVGDSTRG